MSFGASDEEEGVYKTVKMHQMGKGIKNRLKSALQPWK